ncbi:ABC transporter ATP-binding protein [Athalassotoga saccharophila]|uniref:ABC transporter ATP-binding protein n=1 Tax=Athalassotoga saccharophila TaxID=1441386 RepID=UPI001379E31E|nr:ABC transporter ATP-binding protein [Athalassotoga saccharophila]BBJ28629.1 lipoprotein-releasing system ATP-binding protein LolD [Athalassotoga saccharophila]
MADIIVLKSINKFYTSGKMKFQVLHDINLSFEEGSFNSIIGPSGSGKTTLMNIMGILDKPQSGEITIDGERIDRIEKKRLAYIRNQKIGFVFQFHYLLPEFTIYENVLMPYLMKDSKPTKEVMKRAEELIDLVGVSKIKNNMATEASGGQQQKTAIARALMNNPKIILADEPTGNLDSQSTEDIYALLRQINKKYNTTFIIVTHDRRIAERTDRIVEILDGRIISDIKKF